MSVTLCPKEKENIENVALDFLKTHFVDSLPIDPLELAKKEGLKIVYKDLDEENFDGMLQEINGDRILTINNKIANSARARFIAAHEIGHAKLKHQTINYYSNQRSKNEIEANLFARALLMPRPYFEKAQASYNENSVFDSLAEYISMIFGVTEKRAKERLEDFD